MIQFFSLPIDWSAVATSFVGAVAAVSAGFAYLTIRSNRESKSKEIWTQYLRFAFENSYLTRMKYSDLPIEDEQLDSSGSRTGEKRPGLDRERYEWLVSIMFFAAEEIVFVVKGKAGWSEWKETIKNQIRYYEDYIFGEGAKYNPTYDPRIIELINEVAAETPEQRKLLGGTRA